MKINYFAKYAITLFFAILSFQFVWAQDSSRNFWKKMDQNQLRTSKRSAYPTHFEAYTLQTGAMKNYLSNAPIEITLGLRQSSFIIELPTPDGSFNRYTLVESPVMEEGLAAAYPFIKTYAGQGIDDPTAAIRCDMTQFGFHSYVLSANGIIYIDPVEFGNSENYMVYFKHDIPGELYRPNCLLKTDEEKAELNNAHDRLYQPTSIQSIGSQLRTYRLALAADGEFTAFYGGTVGGALAGITTIMNRVNGVYEKELDIHMNIIANNNLIIYTNAATDPYTDSDGVAMLDENQMNLTSVIGSANYNIGHVFSTGGGGIAGLGVVCNTTYKANGVTGLPDPPGPIGDAFAIDFVAHEMGHQFGAYHTFNCTTGNCGGNTRDAGSAFEPGSGSTIMGYAGICTDTNDLQNNSDAYFHSRSFYEIVNYSTSGGGGACAVATSTGNNPPVLTMPALSWTIPYQTPFKLTATATDADADPLTFCWEQYDLGPSGNWSAPSGNAPLFRSIAPVSSGTRLFPKLNKILTPASVDVGEVMATYARSVKFRCTVRDNRASGGGVIYSPFVVTVNVINTTVPFAITAPNTTGISWIAGTTHTVTWNVAATDVTPINTANVNIYLSTDNGTSFPINIATAVPNNGSYSFTVPNNPTANARVMVEGAGNIFFDINDKKFTITAPVGITEYSISNNINLYPNPAGNEFHFVLNTQTPGLCRITLNDLAGRMIKELSFEKNHSMADRTIDLSDVAGGMYLVRFELPEGISEKKLIKE